MKSVFVVAFLLAVASCEGKPRIIGGISARVQQFPFSAAIYAQSGTSRNFCGGALISSEWILTSANCIIRATSFDITLGSNNLAGTDNNRVKLATTTAVTHPDFDPLTLNHDIGLLRLRIPIVFNDYVQTINLPSQDMAVGSSVLVTGWGQISDDIPGPVDHLRYAPVVTLSNDECKLTYGTQVTEYMVCVAGNNNEGTCVDDAGSALVAQANQNNTHIGVASFYSGNGCENSDPSGYASTYYHVDWIKMITGIN